MEYFERLKKALIEFGLNYDFENKSCKIDFNNNSTQRLNEALFSIGKIIKVNDDIMIAEVKCGFANLGTAYIAAIGDSNATYAVAMAKEGLVKQHLVDKSLHLLNDYYEKRRTN